MKKGLLLYLIFVATTVFGITRPDWTLLKNKPFFDIKEFGAKGDGSTDDTAAIVAAIASAQASVGGKIIFRQGTYKVTATLTIPVDTPMEISGIAPDSTVINYVGSGTCFSLIGSSSYVQKTTIKDLRVTTSTGGSNGVHVETATKIVIDNVIVDGFVNGIYFKNTWVNKVTNTTLTRCYNGAYFTENSNAITFDNCELYNNSNSGVYIVGGRANNFNGCTIETNASYGAVVSVALDGTLGTHQINFSGCYFEGNGANDILTTSSVTGIHPKNTTVSRNYFVALSGEATSAIRTEHGTGIDIDGNYFTGPYTYSLYVPDTSFASNILWGKNSDGSSGQIFSGSGQFVYREDRFRPHAWGSFLGQATGSCTVTNSYCVAGVVASSTASGSYTISMKKPLDGTNYTIISSAEQSSVNFGILAVPQVLSSSTFTISTATSSAGPFVDAETVNFVVFGIASQP